MTPLFQVSDQSSCVPEHVPKLSNPPKRPSNALDLSINSFQLLSEFEHGFADNGAIFLPDILNKARNASEVALCPQPANLYFHNVFMGFLMSVAPRFVLFD
jgi:hypothetical protein